MQCGLSKAHKGDFGSRFDFNQTLRVVIDLSIDGVVHRALILQEGTLTVNAMLADGWSYFLL